MGFGANSQKHAIKFHQYKSKNILLGNNRIDQYFDYRNKNFSDFIKFKKPYILFLGTNLLFREELKCLKTLDLQVV